MSKVILSLETSSTICSTAIIENDDVLSCVEELCPREHNERLPQFIKTTLADCNKTIEDVDALAISIGPGSFTGLRIGLGFSKGLAYSKGLPIIPVPTILSLAFALRDFEPENGILHSHAKKIFYQEFDWKDNIPRIKDKAIVNDIDAYLDGREIGFHSNCGIFFGTDDGIQEVIHSARHIGLLAYLFFDEWIIDRPYDLVPDYIAPFEIKRSVR